jgi:hypothetical protein
LRGLFFHKIPALGMKHDFDEDHGGTDDQFTAKNACNYQGFMSYGDHKSKWSECSVKDFTTHYNKYKKNWCMPGKYMFSFEVINFKVWTIFKRSIFQTLWKDDCCIKSLFFELEASNFGYLLIL